MPRRKDERTRESQISSVHFFAHGSDHIEPLYSQNLLLRPTLLAPWDAWIRSNRLRVLTRKSGVYSFGVLLLELLSGSKAIHNNESGVLRNMVDYVVPYVIGDEAHRILNTRVPSPNPVEMEAVAYVGYLATDCVMMPEGKDRSTMRQLAESLVRALEACMGTTEFSGSTTASSG